MKDIKIVFNDGHEETMTTDKALELGLTVANRFTLTKWKRLLDTMNKLKISSFEDPNFIDLELTVVYEYVVNQVKAHEH